MHEYLEGKIDFVGQQQAEELIRMVLIGMTALSFVVGLALQSLQATFGIFGLATVVLAMMVVPPWPSFNKHPVKWLTVKKKE